MLSMVPSSAAAGALLTTSQESPFDDRLAQYLNQVLTIVQLRPNYGSLSGASMTASDTALAAAITVFKRGLAKRVGDVLRSAVYARAKGGSKVDIASICATLSSGTPIPTVVPRTPASLGAVGAFPRMSGYTIVTTPGSVWGYNSASTTAVTLTLGGDNASTVAGAAAAKGVAMIATYPGHVTGVTVGGTACILHCVGRLNWNFVYSIREAANGGAGTAVPWQTANVFQSGSNYNPTAANYAPWPVASAGNGQNSNAPYTLTVPQNTTFNAAPFGGLVNLRYGGRVRCLGGAFLKLYSITDAAGTAVWHADIVLPGQHTVFWEGCFGFGMTSDTTLLVEPVAAAPDGLEVSTGYTTLPHLSNADTLLSACLDACISDSAPKLLTDAL